MKALSKKPLHGYKLMKIISESCMNLWKPTSGALYPALEELRKEKLIRLKSETKTGRKRKEYAITKLGRKKFFELSKTIEKLEEDFLKLHKSPELMQYSMEDGVYLLNLICSLTKGEFSNYKGVMLEFAMLSRLGKISKKQEQEFKNALLEFVKKIKKINEKAKKQK